MIKPAIEIVEVSKSFGATLALNRVSFNVGTGEFFSLLGPSGCGKTTLLRMIAGFEEPSSGCLMVDGKDMTLVPPHKRPVNLVFQNYALFPHLSVFDNVAFGLRATRLVGKSDIAQHVQSALELVRLASYKDHFPGQLSGGQQQRVALARAFVNRPTVLLLDEPLSALDSKIRQEMQEELAQFQRQLGITFVMVTHDQNEALALSNRMAVFNKGFLEQVGTPEEIFNRPVTPFVADFIGQNNLFAGKVLEWCNQYAKVRIDESLMLWVRDEGMPITSLDQTVTVWFRTHAVRLCASQVEATRMMADLAKEFDGNCHSLAQSLSNGPTNCFEAKVTHRSYQGSSTDYHLTVRPQLDLQASLIEAGERNFKVGDTVFVVIPPNQAAMLLQGEAQNACLARGDLKLDDSGVGQENWRCVADGEIGQEKKTRRLPQIG